MTCTNQYSSDLNGHLTGFAIEGDPVEVYFCNNRNSKVRLKLNRKCKHWLYLFILKKQVTQEKEQNRELKKEVHVLFLLPSFHPSFHSPFFISSFFVIFTLIRLRRHLSFRERLSLSNPCRHIARKVNSSKKHKHTRTHTYTHTHIRVHAVRCTVTVHHHYLHGLIALFSMYRILYHPNSTIAQPITHRLSHF